MALSFVNLRSYEIREVNNIKRMGDSLPLTGNGAAKQPRGVRLTLPWEFKISLIALMPDID